jgi:uncharacterized membrane protein
VSSERSAAGAPAALEADLAEHVQAAVDTIAAFHRDHREASSRLQRTSDLVTATVGRPDVMGVILVGLLGWVLAAVVSTHGRVEAPPFIWLELAATLAALVLAMLILVTQRRQETLVERRDQLTLELAILSDRKLGKLIALIEELRRDAPELADRHDAESEAMAQAADPQAVIAALERRTAPDGEHDAEAGRT